ncbi:glycoside hydrolase family 28 protein [Hyaloscypha bicolor E]|uniref:Glycoside hydrolase family 28 protein n=1 Tax=Hyaloscypha bicolor E TaxID=1095630 RepID=A0A2J6SG47_9HELO|nr:glycoside hydrolase family 28 protein [Hyaloscypha bicolor E]PMD49720.1 glycoside hydrolase family 28 protein [Hyaloscypha bicolor E]
MLFTSLHLAFVAILLVGAIAAPTDELTPGPVVLAKRATCTPATMGDDQLDDTPAIIAAIASCGSGGTIVIPAGTTYSLRTMLTFSGCVNCDFQLEGTLKASDDTTYWATVPTFARPTAIYINGGSDITITGLTVKNVPNVFFGQKGGVTNVNYASLTMTAASKSTNLPKNTDGFDIGESTYTTIKSVYVSNQDDCVAFKSGCNYVTVDGITCAGTNHGLSVGSLGKTNADWVKNVYVTGATMINCSKAAGIKVYPGGSTHGTSTVSNVTWDGVTVSGCDYGAQIQSCYGSTAAECTADPSAASLTGIYFKNFQGTTNTKYEPAVSNLDCPPAGTCDLYFASWAVVPPAGTAENLCANIDYSQGITCTAGASG